MSATREAGFDWARKIPVPAFRAWTKAQGIIPDGTHLVIMAVPATTVAEILTRLDDVEDADQVWLAIADGTGPYGYRLLKISTP